jgi:putative transcriptional regulator
MPIYNKLKILIAEKELREGRKLPQRVIAQEADIPLSVLTLYISQKVRRFDTETLQKLCRYFGVQPGDLLVYSDNSSDHPKQKTARK